jgi:hypothetical protein
MNTSEIIGAISNCEDYGELTEIRKALDARAETIKAELMAKAEAMGLALHDANGRPTRKRRNSHKEPEPKETNSD